MALKRQSKRFFLHPRSLIFVFIVLAGIMISSALIELNQSKKELLDLMKQQAHTLLETVLISSKNALLTYEHLEVFLEERLLNNAGFINYLYNRNKLNSEFLSLLSQTNNIYRIDIISPNGKKIFTSNPGDNFLNQESASLIETLQPIFKDEQDTLIIGYRQAKVEKGMRYSIALATNNRNAIVLNLNADDLLRFRREIGFGSLLKDISNNPGIVYVALQDTMGIIAASENVTELERINDSDFLKRALQDSIYTYRMSRFDSEHVFESVHSFYYNDIPVGLFRLGLSVAPLNQIKARIYRRIVIITLILISIGFIVFALIIVRQNYHLLQRQYQVVETYSSNIIQNVSDAIMVLDKNDDTKIINQAAEDLFHIKEKSVIGKPLNQFISEPQCKELLLTSASMKQIECTIQDQRKVLLVSNSIFYDETGNQNKILVIKDLTEIRKLEEQIQRRERLSAMGELASGVAHEIRNPLNAIGTIVQQLDKDFEPAKNEDEYHQLAGIVTKEVQRINKTIENFLLFARPKSIEPEKFKLSGFIEYLHQQYKSMFEEHKIKFSLSLDWDGTVQWDRQQMQQVFMNLIQNAVDAIGKDGTIQIEINNINQHELEIIVQDDGGGISDTIKSKIFNLYFTTKGKGTGIGLSIVQQIIYEHNGIISLESEKNRGAKIIIRLPIVVAN